MTNHVDRVTVTSIRLPGGTRWVVGFRGRVLASFTTQVTAEAYAILQDRIALAQQGVGA